MFILGISIRVHFPSRQLSKASIARHFAAFYPSRKFCLRKCGFLILSMTLYSTLLFQLQAMLCCMTKSKNMIVLISMFIVNVSGFFITFSKNKSVLYVE